MTAHRFVDQMLELDIMLSHSRPRVSNDNPMSESQFATLKGQGQPDYPDRFAHAGHARAWHASYFDWYNLEHHHSVLAGYTLEQVFTGRHSEVILTRQAAIDDNYRRHPERFVAGPPNAKAPPAKVRINPYTPQDRADAGALPAVNFPTLPMASEKIMLSAK